MLREPFNLSYFMVDVWTALESCLEGEVILSNKLVNTKAQHIILTPQVANKVEISGNEKPGVKSCIGAVAVAICGQPIPRFRRWSERRCMLAGFNLLVVAGRLTAVEPVEPGARLKEIGVGTR